MIIEWLTADLFPRWAFIFFTFSAAIGGYMSGYIRLQQTLCIGCGHPICHNCKSCHNCGREAL